MEHPSTAGRHSPDALPDLLRSRWRVQVTGDRLHPVVPAGAIYVGRPAPYLTGSVYQNPHSLSERGCRLCHRRVHTRAEAVALYAAYWVRTDLPERAERELRDRILACWCRLTETCHADVIIAHLHPTDVQDGLW